VHALLEWSANNDWAEPDAALTRRFAAAAGLDGSDGEPAEALLEPLRAWLGSGLFEQKVRPASRLRAEVPLLLELGGTVLRGSIDLLVEREGAPPLIVDYKTDRLGDASPAEHAERYRTQRDIYALATGEFLRRDEVEVAYVFLERVEEPALLTLGRAEVESGRRRLEATIERLRAAA
jgi:ATP-dependent exoDNAse (exonuclease V) beta subunit